MMRAIPLVVADISKVRTAGAGKILGLKGMMNSWQGGFVSHAEPSLLVA